MYVVYTMAILLLLQTVSNSLQLVKHKFSGGKIYTRLYAGEKKENLQGVAVVGFSGGAAEVVAYKLSSAGYPVSVILDDEPISPMVKKSIDYYCGDLEKQLDDASGKLHTTASLLQGKIVIAVGDSVPDDDATSDEPANALFAKLARIVPTSAKAIICAASARADGGNALSKMFGSAGPSALKKFATTNSVPFSLVKFGRLTGGIPGAEPIPFMSMPLLEPELHPSYVLRAAVLSTSENKFSAVEMCTRDMLGETISKVISQGVYRSNSFDAQVISIAGSPPTSTEWEKLFIRMSSGSNVELLRIDFAQILKPQALTNWIADTWFPQALIDADAATILTGARPVRATKLPNGNVKIVWDDIQKDLTVKRVGELEIRVETTGTPSISAIRLSSDILPGEMQLMEKLVEGVNKNVFKKQLCMPLISK